jgi:hypothetical protein
VPALKRVFTSDRGENKVGVVDLLLESRYAVSWTQWMTSSGIFG